jgi:chromosome segregation protein
LREQASREREWRRSLLAESEREVSDLDLRQGEVMVRLSDLRTEAGRWEAKVVELDAQLARLEGRDLEVQLAEWRTQMTLTRQQHAARQAELAGNRRTWQQIEQQIAERRRRVDELAAELSQTEGRIGELRGQEESLGRAIQASVDRMEPVERELDEMEGQQVRLEREEGETRTRLQASESRYGQVQIEVARQEDHMNSLRQQIRDAFGLVDLDMGDELSGQPPLPLTPLVSSLPEVEVLPEGLEGQIGDLKRRLRYLEPVNPDAPEEYEEARQRCDFLSTQARDLEQASAQLREVIVELDTMMEHEFKRTFHAVSREFRGYFDQLFGGGSARLELTDPDDLVGTGIDVVVRPPGKRLQGLAVLSGGERALTAAALVFSILTVSPTPFCVLDEVDAALDEANVGRFRAALQTLARGTQFVVITHNRYTIEIADTIYGISMGADGSSCVISHQLNRPQE